MGSNPNAVHPLPMPLWDSSKVHLCDESSLEPKIEAKEREFNSYLVCINDT